MKTSEELITLARAMMPYVDHAPICQSRGYLSNGTRFTGNCTCGFYDLMARLREAGVLPRTLDEHSSKAGDFDHGQMGGK